MATHDGTQHEPHHRENPPEGYPRNLERERHNPPHTATHPAGSREAVGPDGGMVRSEPVSSRTGDGRPAHPEPHEGGPAVHGDGDGHPHTHADHHAGEAERLIRAEESDDLRRRWESIQASFIDSPREAVQEADRLVGELTDRIAERFRSERSGLDAQWERGGEVSTEELRLTLQRYRGFFDRLLHL